MICLVFLLLLLLLPQSAPEEGEASQQPAQWQAGSPDPRLSFGGGEEQGYKDKGLFSRWSDLQKILTR
jgi:hypothetical protein